MHQEDQDRRTHQDLRNRSTCKMLERSHKKCRLQAVTKTRINDCRPRVYLLARQANDCVTAKKSRYLKGHESSQASSHKRLLIKYQSESFQKVLSVRFI